MVSQGKEMVRFGVGLDRNETAFLVYPVGNSDRYGGVKSEIGLLLGLFTLSVVASTANFSNSPSTSERAVSANIWCSLANPHLKPGAHGESHEATGFDRLLHGAYDPLPSTLRVSGVGP